MCNPVLAVGAGLAVSGAVAQNRAAAKSAKAVNSARSDEQKRQELIQRQAEGTFGQALQGFTRGRQEDDRQSIDDARNETVQRAITNADTKAVPISKNANSAVAQALAGGLRNAVVQGRESGGALARLGSVGEQDFRNKISLQNSGTRLNQLSSFAQGSLGVLPAELFKANQAGGDLAALGDILGGAGQLTSFYGLSQGSPGTRGAPGGYQTSGGPGPFGSYRPGQGVA